MPIWRGNRTRACWEAARSSTKRRLLLQIVRARRAFRQAHQDRHGVDEFGDADMLDRRCIELHKKFSTQLQRSRALKLVDAISRKLETNDRAIRQAPAV